MADASSSANLNQDKEFLALPSEEKRKYLSAVDKDFAGLSENEQYKYLKMIAAGGSGEESQFTITRQKSATEEPAFKALERATGPTLAAIAALHPAVRFGQAAILAGGAIAANQLLGLESDDPIEIAKALAIPYGARGIAIAGRTAIAGGKSVFKGLSELINPGALKEAGVEAVAERLGQAPRSLERIFTTPKSQAAYKAVQQEGQITLKGVADAIQSAQTDLENLANPPKAAINWLKNLGTKFNPVKVVQEEKLSSGGILDISGKPIPPRIIQSKITGTNTADYGNVVEEMQILKARANAAFRKADNATGIAFNEARAKILDKLDQISPAVKKANALYRKEQSTQDIINVVRGGNPGANIRKLFENDALVAGTFTPGEVKDIYKITDLISDVASSAPAGLGRQALSAITEPIGQALASDVGRYLLRKTLTPVPGITSTPMNRVVGLSAVAQFMRAYTAQGRE